MITCTVLEMMKRLNYFVPSGLGVIAMGNGVRCKHFVGIKAQRLFTAAWCLFAFTEDRSVYITADLVTFDFILRA